MTSPGPPVLAAVDVLRAECTKCARKGRSNIRRLIEKYGRKNLAAEVSTNPTVRRGFSLGAAVR
jgi:hypothetical protein